MRDARSQIEREVVNDIATSVEDMGEDDGGHDGGDIRGGIVAGPRVQVGCGPLPSLHSVVSSPSPGYAVAGHDAVASVQVICGSVCQKILWRDGVCGVTRHALATPNSPSLCCFDRFYVATQQREYKSISTAFIHSTPSPHLQGTSFPPHLTLASLEGFLETSLAFEPTRGDVGRDSADVAHECDYHDGCRSASPTAGPRFICVRAQRQNLEISGSRGPADSAAVEAGRRVEEPSAGEEIALEVSEW